MDVSFIWRFYSKSIDNRISNIIYNTNVITTKFGTHLTLPSDICSKIHLLLAQVMVVVVSRRGRRNQRSTRGGMMKAGTGETRSSCLPEGIRANTRARSRTSTTNTPVIHLSKIKIHLLTLYLYFAALLYWWFDL